MSPPTCPRPWCDLPADLLGHVMAHLPFPADRARFRAVCRAWRSAAREHHARRRGLPWIVLPNASFCTIGDDGVFFDRIPGLPAENVTCLGAAATGGWLALDCTDAVHRRTSSVDLILTMNTPLPTSCDGGVKHRHTYLVHNPFSSATVELPELDSAFGHVTEEFEVRKVLMMRSSAGDDGDVVVAVTTNSYKYSVVVCRPGKGKCVVPNLRILDLAFLGDTLYAMTFDEDVIAFDLTEDADGRPAVAQYKRVIRRPLADGEKDLGSWMDHHDDDDDGGQESESDDDEAPDDMESDGGYKDSDEDESDVDEISGNGVEEAEDESHGDDEAPRNPTEHEEDVFNSYGKVAHTIKIAEPAAAAAAADEANDSITIARYLVASSDGKELLMVRHHQQTPPFSDAYTLKVEVFRADLSLREWVPVAAGGLAGEALFLSGSFSMSTPAYGGGIEEGLVYFVAPVDDVFDTRSWVPRTFSMPWQRKLAKAHLLTWLFPPELVV